MAEQIKVSTSCEGCIFAQLNDDGSQTSCKLGRLEKFAEQGVQLDIDTETNKFIIKDRICVMKFTQEQWDRHPEIKDPEIDLRKLIAIKATTYILVNNQDLGAIRKTTESLINQTLKPQVVNIILCSNAILVKQVAALLRSLEEQHPDLAWQITNIVDRDADGVLPAMPWCIDHAVANCPTPGYATFEAGFEVPKTYLA